MSESNEMSIGIKLKRMRMLCGLTQEELADRCELTKGYISQLENDLNSPSIATLKDILQALGSTLREFFDEEPEPKLVFTPQDFIEKNTDGMRLTWLVPNAQKNQMEPTLVELAPGASTADDFPHEGEEFGLVLDGRITLTVGKNKYALKKGESFYFKSDKNHSLKNTGSSTGSFFSTG